MNNFKSQNTDNLQFDQLEQLVESPEAQAAIEEQFGAATEELDGVSRRRWLQIMGASLALGGAVGCRYEEEQIAPFVFRPHNRIPGESVKYATSIDFGGVSRSLLATSFDGRPIKLDGNPESPDSLGGSDVFIQARVSQLYDPDRLRGPQTGADGKDGKMTESTWEAFSEAARGLLNKADLSKVAILSEPNSSPTMAGLRKQFEGKNGKWFEFASVSDDNTRAGTAMAFGSVHRAQYDFESAQVIVSLDSDFIGLHPGGIKNARQFANGRDADHGKMNRMYCVETQYTTTGASADHRMSLPASKIASFAAALKTAVESASKDGHINKELPYRERLLAAMAQDLKKNKGKGIILAGESQPPEVHALVHELNQSLGNNGRTIKFTKHGSDSNSLESLKAVCDGISDGSIDTLVIVGGNPAYSAPVDYGFADKLAKVNHSIHLSMYRNETSLKCKWICDMAHPLEAWGDGISYDGSWCLAQPLIRPLHGSKSEIEILASVMSDKDADGLELVKASAKEKLSGDFEAGFATAVELGFVEGSAAEPVSVSPSGSFEAPADDGEWLNSLTGEKLEMRIVPSRAVYDGRFSNLAWLQELPDFITKVTWDNVAQVCPKTAKSLKLKQDKLCVLKINGKEVKLPVNVTPGTAEGCVVVQLGYGRTAAGRVGGDELRGIESVGHDISTLRSSSGWHFTRGAEALASRTTYKLANTQEPWDIDKTGRDEIQARMFVDKKGNRSTLLREGTWASYQKFMEKHGGEHDHGHHAAVAPPVKRDPTALPVINNVSLETVEDSGHGGGGDGHDDGSHGTHSWPEVFHLHHQNKDLTPGVRRQYTQQDPSITNVWGMGIDLNKCNGCNACVIACQAENNVPVVGKWQVWRGREMHWMRIDRYFGENLYNKKAAEEDDKQVVHQPVTCHHCENAPCETVCPVAATVHSHEGLNDMVYNRCIGTRYCGNNCPYKVRRFNFLNYSDAPTFLGYPGDMGRSDLAPSVMMSQEDKQMQNLMMNPEVTVRSRGVMEKCTYCTQRISKHKIKAKVEHRELEPNEIRTACQDACPANAITFGDLHNAKSDVAHAHGSKRAYVMLEELNNWPRTRYLSRVRNPHPDMVDFDYQLAGGGHGDGHGTEETKSAH